MVCLFLKQILQKSQEKRLSSDKRASDSKGKYEFYKAMHRVQKNGAENAGGPCESAGGDAELLRGQRRQAVQQEHKESSGQRWSFPLSSLSCSP